MRIAKLPLVLAFWASMADGFTSEPVRTRKSTDLKMVAGGSVVPRVVAKAGIALASAALATDHWCLKG